MAVRNVVLRWLRPARCAATAILLVWALAAAGAARAESPAGRSVGFGLCAALLVYLAAAPMLASACSCAWRGPFLTVAPGAPLVVRGRVLRHHPGPGPAMDVLVLETLTGGLLDSGLRVQMGDGMQCRPDMAGFPAGSEWVLALNGPGAKPGDGLALSHCGEYWVRVEGDEAVGRLEGGQGETTRMPLSELRLRLRFIFSPEVGRRIAGPDARRAVTLEEVEAVRRFGRGTLTIERCALRPGSDGCPQPEWIEFSVYLEGGF